MTTAAQHHRGNDGHTFHEERALNWETCQHKFSSWFGPVLKCGKCGATTMACMDKGESKPIFPPVSVHDDIGVID